MVHRGEIMRLILGLVQYLSIRMILNRLLWAFFTCLHLFKVEAYMTHQRAIQKEWKEENTFPFDELMISWNAPRPSEGKYLFYVSVKTNEWSPWLLYASWGSDGQASFHSKTSDDSIRVYQDALEVVEAKGATGFQIKVVPEGNAASDLIHGLHVYTNGGGQKELSLEPSECHLTSVYLPVKGLSQITLKHIRHMHLCSPTSTTAAVRYLSNNPEIDPLHFAQNVWDAGFDIFGNWVFNVAHAAAILGPAWDCWVERLSGFDDIHRLLHQGTPVVVSVRGPLPGSALPYSQGHLMVVIGYDSEQKKVICMDPGFPSDEETVIRYDLSDFDQAWKRRGRVAYIYTRVKTDF